MSWMVKPMALSLFVLVPLPGTGCIRDVLGKATEEALDNVAKVVADLEAQGVNYRAEAYLPADLLFTWNPFGGEVRLPGGYVRVLVARGRGLGNRPVDFPPVPYQPPGRTGLPATRGSP